MSSGYATPEVKGLKVSKDLSYAQKVKGGGNDTRASARRDNQPASTALLRVPRRLHVHLCRVHRLRNLHLQWRGRTESFRRQPHRRFPPSSLYVLAYGLGPLIFAPLSEVPLIGRSPVYTITFLIFVILTALVNNFACLLVLRQRFRIKAACIAWSKREGTGAKNATILGMIPQECIAANSTKGFRDLRRAEIDLVERKNSGGVRNKYQNTRGDASEKREGTGAKKENAAAAVPGAKPPTSPIWERFLEQQHLDQPIILVARRLT